MSPLYFLALSECPSGSALDWMLRAIGVAAIIWAFFNGVRSLIVKKPTAANPAPAPAPLPAIVPVPQQAPSAADTTPEISQDIPQEIVAVIASAVHYIIGHPHRIISLKRVDPSWEKSGRQSILTSHKIR